MKIVQKVRSPMTLENYILSILAGFFMGWIANTMSKSRYSFPINLFVAIFGAILMNFFLRSTSLIHDEFMPTLLVSMLGSAILLGLFHLTRAIERRP